MYAYATTTISILRGSDATDEFLDTAPSDSVFASGIPASIIDRQRVIATPDSPEPVVVTYTTGRVGSGTDIRYEDRIKDERTGSVYQIKDMTGNQNPMSTPDIRLQLIRVSDYGTS